MGREVKRVALDFDWPLNKVWKGYLNSNYVACPEENCEGGTTREGWLLDEFFRQLALAGGNSYERPEDFVAGRRLRKEDVGPDELSLLIQRRFAGNEQYLASMRESAIRRAMPRWPWSDADPVETLLKAADLPPDWATDKEKEVIRLIARQEQSQWVYEWRCAQYQPNERRCIIVSKYAPSARGTINYPHPHLCEDGIGDVGPRFYELVVALAGGPKEVQDFGRMWRCNYRMQQRVYEVLGYEPDEISEYGTKYYHQFQCKTCNGSGIHPNYKEAYDAWEASEPPAGPGWQLWETVSEGSPVSPVLHTREEFVDYLVEQGRSRTAAERFADSGWAPSMVMKGGEIYQNIDSHDVMGDEK